MSAARKQKFVLHPDLKAKLKEYRVKRNFNPETWTAQKVTIFNDYLRKCGLSGACVSVSGGVDSAVVLALLKKAESAENSPLKRVVGISQPIKSSSWALNRAKEVAVSTKSELIVVDQTALHQQLQSLVDSVMNTKASNFASGQLRSYMRTPVGYYVAQLMSQTGTPAVVIGTGNQDEDGYLAYFCKAGDGVVDIQLIADLHKREVFKVGRYLNVPESILTAAPSADLWEGHTDEDELGFSYDFVELFTGVYLPLNQEDRDAFEKSLSPAAREQFYATKITAETMHNRNKHKLSGPVNLNVKSDSN